MGHGNRRPHSELKGGACILAPPFNVYFVLGMNLLDEIISLLVQDPLPFPFWIPFYQRRVWLFRLLYLDLVQFITIR